MAFEIFGFHFGGKSKSKGTSGDGELGDLNTPQKRKSFQISIILESNIETVLPFKKENE